MRKSGIFILGLLSYANLGLLTCDVFAATSDVICSVCKSLIYCAEYKCPNVNCTQSQLYQHINYCGEYFNSQSELADMAKEMANSYAQIWVELLYSGVGFSDICVQSGLCDAASNCTGCSADCQTIDWAAFMTGHEVKINARCDCNTCTRLYEYRCMFGYYGNPVDSSVSCYKCPNDGGEDAFSYPGTTSISGCGVMDGADSTGTYEYTDMCWMQ